MPRANHNTASVPEHGIKEEILKVATRLFARQGYNGTSLQAIVDEVGIRKPSLLYHYASKEILREAVMSEMLQQWQDRLPRVLAAAARGSDRFEALFDEVTDYFGEDPNRARLILREAVDRPDITRTRLASDFGPWLALLANAIEGGRKAGTVKASVDPEAWLIEMLILVIGAFATSDLMTHIFPGEYESEGSGRQMREIVRIARTSLFPDDADTTITEGSGAAQEDKK